MLGSLPKPAHETDHIEDLRNSAKAAEEACDTVKKMTFALIRV